MNVIAEIQRINAAELANGSVGTSASWHTKYADSAWCYVGNMPVALTEGDVICVMSQWGEIEDIHLVRDDDTGKSKGFCFIKYEDARSCVLAVDNFCGTKVLGRSLRVDHVEKYRLPKHLLEKEEEIARTGPGHAYDGKELANEYNIQQGQDLFAPVKQEVKEVKPGEQIDSISKEERREAKRKRKEERDSKRKEKEERLNRKDEKQRQRRAEKYLDEDRDSHRGRDKDRDRKKKRRKRSRSRSISSR